MVVTASCLVPVAASFAGPTPAVLGGEPLGPIAEALPPVVASAAGVVFALPLVAVAVTLVRMARGGRELRGRLTLPLAALAAVALLVAAGTALPAGLSTALFLVAAPQLPIALIAGSRPIHVVSSTGDTTRAAAAQNVSGEQIQSLTPRERDVLGLMAQGQSNTAIGRSLHISLSAVEKHSTAIFTKLDLPIEPDTHRRVSAVVAYLRATSDA
jgi:DNA-binding CsgD family transcriptional regulator